MAALYISFVEIVGDLPKGRAFPIDALTVIFFQKEIIWKMFRAG